MQKFLSKSRSGGHESTHLLVELLVTMPPHDSVEGSTQEAAVALGLVLRALRHRVCDVTEYLQTQHI